MSEQEEHSTIQAVIRKLMELMPLAAAFLVVGIAFRSVFEVPYQYTSALWVACGGQAVVLLIVLFKIKWRLTVWYDLDKVSLVILAVLFGIGLYGNELAATQGIGMERHIAHFKDMNPWEKSVVWGRVVKDPDIREGKTYLAVAPHKIQKLAKRGRGKGTIKGGVEKINAGRIWVSVKPEIGRRYYELEYGTEVRLRGNLSMPSAATNPNFFDYQRFLRNQGYSASMTINRPDMIQILSQQEPNFLVRFSLKIKQKFLRLIKMTMPYPESAFLGGVQLALRGGVSAEVQEDFRASGVSHVLAVSGLHVTIITAMFWAIFFLLKVPSKISVPIIVFFLLVFTIITGCRPSTSRAAMMNSLALLLMVYSGAKLKSSIVFGVSVAGIVVLANPNLGGPLVAFDPGFTLSFVAILSLAILTDPVTEFLDRHLNGIPLWIFFLGVLGWATTISVYPPLVYMMKFHFLVIVGTIGLIMAATSFQEMPEAVPVMRHLSAGGRLPVVKKTRFSDLPDFLKSFIGAQGAILLGMMWPLSAYYFQRISLSAPFANLIAIPLIGVIVQIGMIASLLGMIPVIGPWMALMLNACNWLLVKLFLFLAHFFAVLMEYPWVPKPTLLQLGLYYLVLLAFVKREAIGEFFIRQLGALRSGMSSAWQKSLSAAKLGTIILLVLLIPVYLLTSKETRVKQTFLDVGLGNCALIEIPGQRAVVIDAGDLNIRYDMETGERTTYSSGERVVFPVLLGKRISRINCIMTSPLLPCAGGVTALVERHGKEIDVGKIVTGLPLAYEDAQLSDEALLRKIGGEQLMERGKASTAIREMAANLKRILTIAAEKKIPLVRVKEGDVMESGPCRFEFHQTADGKLSLEDRSLTVRIVHGTVSTLYTSYLNEAGEKLLIEEAGEELRSDIMSVPANGSKEASSKRFIEAVMPQCAVLQFGYNREKKALRYEWERQTSKRYGKLVNKIVVTDRNNHGALEIISDGKTIHAESLLRGTVLK